MASPDEEADVRVQREPPPERIATAEDRQPPDFVVVGTQCGGTTTLYRHLTEHPNVGAAWRKEVHDFDRDKVYRGKGRDWYLAHFPLRGEAAVVGEATPSYLDHPRAPARARETVPDAKFVALLRNPTDRAYSHCQLHARRGIEPRPFAEAIGGERGPGSGEHPNGRDAYVGRGPYLDHLRRWLDVFPRERFPILKSEDFYRDPAAVLDQTLAFLGLRPWRPARLRVHHRAEYAGMDPATRERLVDHFAPSNRRLYAFLGRDLGWEDE